MSERYKLKTNCTEAVRVDTFTKILQVLCNGERYQYELSIGNEYISLRNLVTSVKDDRKQNELNLPTGEPSQILNWRKVIERDLRLLDSPKPTIAARLPVNGSGFEYVGVYDDVVRLYNPKKVCWLDMSKSKELLITLNLYDYKSRCLFNWRV